MTAGKPNVPDGGAVTFTAVQEYTSGRWWLDVESPTGRIYDLGQFDSLSEAIRRAEEWATDRKLEPQRVVRLEARRVYRHR